MKILIDIGHPAHVHYFRNFISIMKNKGHEFLVIGRDKEVSLQLMKAYGIPFIPRGKGGKGLFGKFLYLFKAELLMYRHARVFKPDVLLGMSSTLAAHVSQLLGKPYIALDDTEHAKLDLLLYPPFTKFILTPYPFFKDFGDKQIRFKGFLEQCYLHRNYFIPDPGIYSKLGIAPTEKYALVRFVSWKAGHDVGKKHVGNEFKIKLVEELRQHCRVFISSESVLSPELEQYKLKTTPEDIHHVLAFSSLFVGEGATMASECAMLGIPSVYINVLTAGTLEEQEKLGLLYGFRSQEGVIEKAVELLSHPELPKAIRVNHVKMLTETIDVTAFLVWFIENYPESAKIMKENPDYQYTFR
jgi:uncharacterized protein